MFTNWIEQNLLKASLEDVVDYNLYKLKTGINWYLKYVDALFSGYDLTIIQFFVIVASGANRILGSPLVSLYCLEIKIY